MNKMKIDVKLEINTGEKPKAKVLCISGKARHGKDSCAEILKRELEKFGKSVVIIHYADYLKMLAKQHFNWDGKKDEKGREILQHLGTDIVRKVNPSLWADVVMLTVYSVFADYDYVIVPDCRFENEIKYWYESDFDVKAIRIVRTGDFDDGLTEEQRHHSSEIDLDDYPMDIIIEAESLEEMELGVQQLIAGGDI